MHERERQRIILSAVQERPVATVQDIVELTGVSEATIRRDIAALALQGRLRKVRGGAEALHPPQIGTLTARPFRVSESVNIAQKRAIAREAVKLCQDGDSIIINGGTTTFQMVHHLAGRRLQVLTNSFAIAEHLVKNTKCTTIVPAGAVYREQNIILSPFENDGTAHFYAKRMFMGAQGVSPLGIMESDSLIIQSEQRLMRQADELVLLVDSSKFQTRSSLILCPLERATTIVTDDAVTDEARRMIETAGITLVIAEIEGAADRKRSSSVA
ncbi:DeoR/GlpR family DNA-binding transcription regulator [Chthonobacter rhizosphaerae]|uniref:DeoR/GlpR family DNA-binding transcription regulator n=1 Tax=Chthonobacter rhizosphaerae TaxID=2735553 RepID=UPI0015EF2203|nr:DeoR/GlpR family DNA-binding transcription regulator [Chthonobacter rhizosphaerae]